MYAWYWPGSTHWVEPPYDIQTLIDLWHKTNYAGLELREFLEQLIGDVK